MSSSKKDQKDTPPASAPASPFAALEKLRDSLPAGPTAQAPPAPRIEPAQKAPARAVVRLERKGRSGKEVTVVEELGLPEKQLAAWLLALKSGLGCGGTVEGDSLILQGDQRVRTRALLEARGVRKVIAG